MQVLEKPIVDQEFCPIKGSCPLLQDALRENEKFREIFQFASREFEEKNRKINNLEPEKTVNHYLLPIKILVFPTKMHYNYRGRIPVSETSLKVRILCNGQRYQKYQNFLRGSHSYTFRRNDSFSTILPKTGPQGYPATAYPLEATKQFVSLQRTHLDDYLYDGGGNEAYLGHQNPSLQQLLSGLAWSERFPHTFHLEGIPQRLDSFGIERNYPYPRSLAPEDARFANYPYQPYLRFGFYYSASLWLENPRSQNRIQSQKAQTTQLLAIALFRRSQPRFLGWDIASGGYWFGYRSAKTLAGYPRQDSQISLSYPYPSRCGVFRPQVYRAARRGRHWLCHSRQNQPTPEGETSSLALSDLQKRRLASSPIQLPALELAEAAPLCGGAPAKARESRRGAAIVSLGIQRLLLSSLCYESGSEAASNLTFLPQEGSRRVGHQRTEREFSSGQNSYQQLPGQRNSLPNHPFGLRLGQLVQENLSAREMAFGYLADFAQRTLGFACKTICSGHKNQLKLPPGYVHQKLFFQSIKKIEQVKIP